MPETQHPLCYELKIHVPEEHKNLIAEILEELEIGDFVFGQIDCDLEAEYDPAKASVDLYENLNENPPLIIYHEDKEYLASVQLALETLLPKVNIPIQAHTFLLQKIADQNWRESWKQSFKPVLVNSMFAILPPWEKPENFSQKFKIMINPGMAFGTGQHETTRLCLEMMAHFAAPLRFFDVGTGSGILAIAAQLLGVKFVLGNDIDPECMAVAQENAKNNSAENIHFSNLPVSQILENNFDMIVANIQSRPLKTLVPEILNRLSLEGTLILSGILVAEKEDFIKFLIQHHVHVSQTRDLNHWCAIACKKDF